jgi:hypothetical protein
MSAAFSILTYVIGPKYGLIQEGQISKHKLLLLILPGIAFCVTFMPLVYIAWFPSKGSTTFQAITKGVYWVMVSGMTFIWVAFLWQFIVK